jgi:UDP-N-acetylmuramate--alanine ligase
MTNTYHFIGIGGIGMSALARILAQSGAKVSGSDSSFSHVIESLRKEGIDIAIGHHEDHLQSKPTVVYSSAVTKDNPEYRRAEVLRLPLLHRAELLGNLMQGSSPLLVAGTHGKTTTSSILAHLLVSCGLKPTFAIGGVVLSLGTNGGFGQGDYFVAEADESDGSFLKYGGFGAIITNIDNDHLDYWKEESALSRGFEKFIHQISSKEHLFWHFDDDHLRLLKPPGVSYGFHPKADLSISSYRQVGWENIFDFSFQGRDYKEVRLPLIGGHNVLNGAAVFGLCLMLNISEEAIRGALSSFQGVGRRVEKKGEKGGISIYDDYAHHPTEVFATLHAIKRAIGEHRRLVVAFQPHRYTRTKDCMDQFPEVFDVVDELFLTDIYSAGEKPIEGVTIEVFVEKIQEKSQAKVHYIPRLKLVDVLVDSLRPQDVLVTMGAGDITSIGREVIEIL